MHVDLAQSGDLGVDERDRPWFDVAVNAGDALALGLLPGRVVGVHLVAGRAAEVVALREVGHREGRDDEGRQRDQRDDNKLAVPMRPESPQRSPRAIVHDRSAHLDGLSRTLNAPFTQRRRRKWQADGRTGARLLLLCSR